MLNHATSLSATLLRLTIIFSCWWKAQSVLAENITVEDTDLSILYQPAASWHSSLEACSMCLKLGTPPSLSYHECTYPFPPDKRGRTPSFPKPSTATAAAVPQVKSNQSPNTPTQISPLSTPPAVPAEDTTPRDVPEFQDDHNGKFTGGNSNGGGPGKGGRRAFRPGIVISRVGLNDHDPNFVHPDITVSFNFTGSALYVFGIQPRGVANDGAPTSMNLSFTLDNQPSGNFHSTGRPGATGFNLRVPVFIKRDLEESSHHFIARVGRNSTFLLDYIIYTSLANATVDGTSTSLVSPTILPQSSPSSVIDPKTKKHNVATFAAAVGGSVGVLGVFSLGLAISIIRRRRQAARRDRLESQSDSATASNDSPRMFGPAPFIPRFFPDTIIPTDPPTYTVALATSSDNSALLASIGSRSGQTSAHRSYADIPPASPPPPLDDVMVPPPPPFPVAVSAHYGPPPPPLHEGAGIRLLPETVHPQNESNTILSSHVPDPVSIATSDSNFAAPEPVSLHQEVDDIAATDRPPQSRLSSNSLTSQISLGRSETRTSRDHASPPSQRPHNSEEAS